MDLEAEVLVPSNKEKKVFIISVNTIHLEEKDNNMTNEFQTNE